VNAPVFEAPVDIGRTPDPEGHLVPSRWPHLLVKQHYAGPKEYFSASQLEEFAGLDGCKRKWAFRYIWGLRAPSGIGQTVGTRGHEIAQAYLQHKIAPDLNERITIPPSGRRAEYDVYPGQIFLSGAHHLPIQEGECSELHTEHPIAIDTRKVIANIEPINFTGSKDVLARQASTGMWAIWDHKFIKSIHWYAKPVERLITDPQGIVYALDVLQNHAGPEQDGVPFRWVYYQTDGELKSAVRDVWFTPDHVQREATSLIIQADMMRQIMRSGESPLDVPPSPDVCRKFGNPNQINCHYHVVNGGPCDPGTISLADRAAMILPAQLLKQTKKEKGETKNMTQTAKVPTSLAEIQALLLAQQTAPAAPQPASPSYIQPVAVAPQAPYRPGHDPNWQPAPNGSGQVAPVNTVYTPGAQPIAAPPPAPPQAAPAPVYAPPTPGFMLPPEAAAPASPPAAAPPQAPPAAPAGVAVQGPPPGAPAPPVAEQPAKPARKRRTNAEIAADQAAAGVALAPSDSERFALALQIANGLSAAGNLDALGMLGPITDAALASLKG
jgi:hypothetical protein